MERFLNLVVPKAQFAQTSLFFVNFRSGFLIGKISNFYFDRCTPIFIREYLHATTNMTEVGDMGDTSTSFPYARSWVTLKNLIVDVQAAA